jgi:adenine phosphoribosyltransferase
MDDTPLRTDLLAAFRWIDGHADVWRFFSDGALFARTTAALADAYRHARVTKVAGIEARGFILGAAVARELDAGFVAIRKDAGLLPGEKVVRVAAADYRGREHELRMQKDSVRPGDRVVLVDDWVETGSQVLAAREMIEMCGGELVGVSVIVDQLPEFEPRSKFGDFHALIPAPEYLGRD